MSHEVEEPLAMSNASGAPMNIRFAPLVLLAFALAACGRLGTSSGDSDIRRRPVADRQCVVRDIGASTGRHPRRRLGGDPRRPRAPDRRTIGSRGRHRGGGDMERRVARLPGGRSGVHAGTRRRLPGHPRTGRRAVRLPGRERRERQALRGRSARGRQDKRDAPAGGPARASNQVIARSALRLPRCLEQLRLGGARSRCPWVTSMTPSVFCASNGDRIDRDRVGTGPVGVGDAVRTGSSSAPGSTG